MWQQFFSPLVVIIIIITVLLIKIADFWITDIKNHLGPQGINNTELFSFTTFTMGTWILKNDDEMWYSHLQHSPVPMNEMILNVSYFKVVCQFIWLSPLQNNNDICRADFDLSCMRLFYSLSLCGLQEFWYDLKLNILLLLSLWTLLVASSVIMLYFYWTFTDLSSWLESHRWGQKCTQICNIMY